MTRTGMVEVLQQDYIRTARAKGLGERIVHFRHAFKNASIPVITTLGFLVVGLATGTTIIEIVFTIPGLGRLLVTAVVDRGLSDRPRSSHGDGARIHLCEPPH